jgi:hypothetical protein
MQKHDLTELEAIDADDIEAKDFWTRVACLAFECGAPLPLAIAAVEDANARHADAD